MGGKLTDPAEADHGAAAHNREWGVKGILEAGRPRGGDLVCGPRGQPAEGPRRRGGVVSGRGGQEFAEVAAGGLLGPRSGQAGAVVVDHHRAADWCRAESGHAVGACLIGELWVCELSVRVVAGLIKPVGLCDDGLPLPKGEASDPWNRTGRSRSGTRPRCPRPPRGRSPPRERMLFSKCALIVPLSICTPLPLSVSIVLLSSSAVHHKVTRGREFPRPYFPRARC